MHAHHDTDHTCYHELTGSHLGFSKMTIEYAKPKLSVSLYDLERGEKVNTYYSKRYGVDLVKFTHHNKCILAASKRDSHQRIMYWSLHDNNILCSFIGHSDMITQIDLNPADSTFVSCARD